MTSIKHDRAAALPLNIRNRILHGAPGARFWWGWAATFALTGLLLALVTLPPFVTPGWRVLLMHGFGNVCHQMVERSPSIGGVQLAVCHRCYGVYWGLALGPLALLVLRRQFAVAQRHAMPVVLLSLLPGAMDWLAGVLGIWHNTPASRMATGILFGLVAGLFLTSALAKR